MQSHLKQKLYWKTWCLCWFMLIGLGPVCGQSFVEALQAGQTIKVEWIQQELSEQNGEKPPPRPLFPEELQPGESEIRVGLNLRSLGTEGELVAEVSYLKYLGLPALEENGYYTNTTDLLTSPIILDTRFQDPYFNPQAFLLEVLAEQALPISCQLKDYQQFLDRFASAVKQIGVNKSLLQEQLDWLQKTTLPSALSASSMAAFFCQMMDNTVPDQESPVLLQSRQQKDTYQVDYVQVDHPSKRCLLKGKIQSPATDHVRIKFFQEGDWLNYWQDSLIQLDEEGRFLFSFSLDHSRIISLFHGYQPMRFYFEPGDTLHFVSNANAFYREMQFQGTAQAENEFLLDFYHEMRGDTLFLRYDDHLLEKDPISYFQKVEAKENKELAFLSQRASSLRTGFTTLMDRNLKLEHAGTQWEAAHRFMTGKRLSLDSDLLYGLQKKANLLYRLPRGKAFDFDVEEFLSFQYYLQQHAYQNPSFGGQEDWLMAQLLPSKETFVRHSLMQLFRKYGQLGKLTASGQWQLNQLLSITRDSQLIQEMRVFADGERNLPPDKGYRILFKGNAAPSWSFTDKEGVKVELADFKGKKLLLHIGWADNLDIAMTDIQMLQENKNELPEIVHLLAASSKDQFLKRISAKKGLFIFVPPAKMEVLKEQYFIDNSSNHYFLVDEEGKILANHFDLGTAKKLRGTWEKMATLTPEATWTAEQKLQIWRSLGVGALILLLISGAVLWQRRVSARRDLRRRQLLEVELRGIRSQMNPHFLFNAMSAIQNLIRKQEQEKADLYLGQFAGLMRKTLRNTAEEYIPLMDEIETLKQYCSLESLRQPFQYEFSVDAAIDAHNTYIPSMILQPIIENAIIHGLTPQTAPRSLLVEIKPAQAALRCAVTDNGIGILAAQKQVKKNQHQSVGMNLVRQRLALMGLDKQEHLSITDRSTLQVPAQGTLVSITIPVEQ